MCTCIIVFVVVLRVVTAQVRRRNTDRLWFPLLKRKSFGSGFQLGPDGTWLLLIKRLNAEVQVSEGLPATCRVSDVCVHIIRYFAKLLTCWVKQTT